MRVAVAARIFGVADGDVEAEVDKDRVAVGIAKALEN